MRFTSILVTAATISSVGLATVASATVSVSDPFIIVTATQGSLSGTYIVPLSDPGIFVFADPDIDLWDWNLPGTVPITSGATTLGLISATTGVTANRVVQPDGSVRWGMTGAFNVQATGAPTTFEICFPTLFFGTGLTNAQMQASAGLVGTDQPQGSAPDPNDGITASGAFGTGSAFQAYYNNSVFTDYIFGTNGNPVRGQSFNADGNMSPPGSFDTVPGVMTSIGAKYRFTVSAFDAVAGSFDVTVLPAPGTMALLGLGGFIAARRRRN
jgi:hypothetical protein